MQRIVIFGATSAIAIGCARRWAGPGASFYLVGRDAQRLQTVADDLQTRGATVHSDVVDLDELGQLDAMLERCFASLGDPELCLLAQGTLPDQEQAASDPAVAAACLHSNALAPIALLTSLGERMAKTGQGQIAVISSVAGERGRPSNYPYGAAKAALSAFCDGLRARLYKQGVHLLVVKPGFVATPMTAGLSMPAPLMAEVDQVASDIDRAARKRRNTLYTPWFWAPIMLVIRSLPQFLFKRLSL